MRDLGVRRDLRRLARGAVAGLRGALASSCANVASWTRTSAPWAATTVASVGRVSPVMTILRPGRVGSDDLLGMHAVDDLAPLQAAEVRALGHPQATGHLDVEAPRPRRLDERVAERRAAVADRVRDDLVAVALDRLAGLELDDVSP